MGCAEFLSNHPRIRSVSRPGSFLYIHGASSEEQARLLLMNRILNQRAVDELALQGHERVLEMGAGTGVFARALAAALPRGGVLGIERDPNQFQAARQLARGAGNLELRQGDAYDPPLRPEEWESFDLAHARFLLEHVQRPHDVVRVLVRAIRPGGRIVLVDDDHALLRLWPEPAGLDRLWSAYVGLYVDQDTDPYIGRRLVELLAQAGARPRRCTFFFYGGCSGDPGFQDVVENLAQVFEGVAERIVHSHKMERDEVAAAIAALREWAQGDARALWYALPWAEGTR